MKKRFLTFIVALMIMLLGAFPTWAAGDLPNIVDEADILTQEQEAELNSLFKEASEKQKFDFVVAIVDDIDGKTPEAFADDYYDYNGYGYGDGHDGCLLLISMAERDWHISTTGLGMVAFTDAGVDYISGNILSYLKNDDYYNAFVTFFNLSYDFVEKAKEGIPYDYNNLTEYDSGYRFEDYNGTANIDGRDTDSDKNLGAAVVAGLVIGLIATLIIISILKGQMKTVYHHAQANNYIVDDSLKITNQYDRFVTSRVTKTAKESSSKGGTSGHTGSSGTSHGGGGGKF